MQNSIIHDSAQIENAVLSDSVIGNAVKVQGKVSAVNAGSDSEVIL